MPYEVINGDNHASEPARVVDLRSDTISKPTNEMREAMAAAEVGDDVYGEDPTVRKLEDRSCALFGKEAAVFLPSGTMANLIAIMVHSNRRGSEVICGDNSHTFLFEQGGPAQIAGVQMATVPNKPDGTFCLEEMEEKIRINPDQHEPITTLIIVENTHNMCGGKVLSLDWLDSLGKIAKRHNIPLHMDGARIMNAVVQQRETAARITRDMDSVCYCLSKSLGCPIGSVLMGTRSFIAEAKRMRKVLGGGMRQSGIVAAAGLVGLDKMVDRLKLDHARIYKFAQAIDELNSPLFRVDLMTLQTNILMVYLDRTKVDAPALLKRLATVLETDHVKVSVRASSRNRSCARFVIYWEITDKDIEDAIGKFGLVAKEFHAKLELPL